MLEAIGILSFACLLSAAGIALFLKGYHLGRHAAFQALKNEKPTTIPIEETHEKTETPKPQVTRSEGIFAPVPEFQETPMGGIGMDVVPPDLEKL